MLANVAHEVRVVSGAAFDIWRFRLDFSNLPFYNPSVSAVERIADGRGDGGALGPGAKWRFDLDIAGTTHPVDLTVRSTVEGREVVATMEGALRAEEVFTVEQVDDLSCRVTLELWVDLPDDLPEPRAQSVLEGARMQVVGEMEALVRLFG